MLRERVALRCTNEHPQHQYEKEKHQEITLKERETAAEWAIGQPEQALYWAKYEAKEARIELDDYEKEQRREGRQRLQEAMQKAEDEEKWRRIEEGIRMNHQLNAPGDPEYWDPDAWELGQLFRHLEAAINSEV